MVIYSIYKATNKINGKCYIGFDSKWPHRKSAHKLSSQTQDYKFYRAIRKYGWDNFEWELIYQSKDKEHTKDIMETFFINDYNSFNNGYNSTKGGDGLLGVNHSQQTKQKISLAHKGKRLSEEHKRKMSLANKGKNISEETKQKLSLSLKGRPPNPNMIEANVLDWIITTPEGKTIQIRNLTKFCRENNLNVGHMVRVSDGTRKQHKGYKCFRISKESA